MRVGLALFFGVAIGLSAPAARAQSARFTDGAGSDGLPPSEMEVRLVPDLAFTLSMLGVALLLDQSKRTWEGDMSCKEGLLADGVCDPRSVNVVDRWVIGTAVEGASPLSDALLAGLLISPFVFAGLDGGFRDVASGSTGAERIGRDSLVIAQTYAATYLATNLTKVIVKRLRPFNYNPRFLELRRDGDARVSFPSGHSSMSFAAAATLSVMLDQRFPDEGWAIGVSAAAFAAAAGVATLRVLAARHFPSDVLAGAALGTAIGVFLPRFHRGSAPAIPSGQPTLFTVGGRF